MRRVCLCEFNGGGVSRQPILNCRRRGDSIKVFLATKAKQQNQNKEVYLVGEGFLRGQKVDFQAQTIGGYSHRNLWSMKVSKSSGRAILFNHEDEGTEEEDIVCNENNVFIVTKGLNDIYGVEGDWEKSITNVKLTLDNCQTVDKLEKCDIQIAEDVGLKWNPEFMPKAIFK